MTATVTHAFVNPKSDGGDATITRPSDWNAEHVIDGLGSGGPHELAYAQITSPVSPTATTEATANTVVTASAVTFDGSTSVVIEFQAPNMRAATDAAGRSLTVVLYDGSSSIGTIAFANSVVISVSQNVPVRGARHFTPSAGAHTYSIRAFVSGGTGLIGAGPGATSGDIGPAFIRITRATGGVTLGSSPGARAVTNAVTVLPNITWTSIAFAGTDRFDSDGFHNPASNNTRMTIPAGLDGRYLIGGTVGMEANATGVRGFRIYLNNTTRIGGESGIMPTSATIPTRQNITTVYDLVAGDYVELQAWQSSGGDLNSENTANFTEFWITRLGGTPTSADEVDFNNASSGLAATSVQEALDEIVGEIQSQGTAFPSGPATNDRYFRTDTGVEFFYDGTRWLSSQVISTSFPMRDTNTFPMSASGTFYGTVPLPVTTNAWLVGFNFTTYVDTTNSGSAYWTVTPSQGSAFNTSADGVATVKTHYVAVGASTALTDNWVYFSAIKTSTPGTLLVMGEAFWRFIGT